MAATGLLSARAGEQAIPPLRPPAVPLVACDPYFSIWSPADTLNGADTVHWTGKPHRLSGSVWIDGKQFRVIGSAPDSVPALSQKSVEVLPTRTIYRFEDVGIQLVLTFTTPALPDDLDVLSRPVTYLTYEVKAVDGKEHEIEIGFQASGELTVNEPNQAVTGELGQNGEVRFARMGSKDQPILAKKGDDIRIDWGYFYLAIPSNSRASLTPFGPSEPLEAGLKLPMEKVGGVPSSHWFMLAYDDLFSIQYMKKNLRPYWRRTGWEAGDLLQAAAKDYEPLRQRCEQFDAELMADLRKAGGEKYARLAALAFRQCFAAGKFVADDNGKPLQFCKENHSNGCISTSDVFYPMAPQFLLFGPTLAKSFVVPFMNYAASERWKFPFAPHDLGQYPHANGQRYGGGERTEENQMPVEESGNLLILFGAIAQMEGNADFAGLYWKTLEQWAEYLKAKGFDPENQLCTDDFAGHLAHNVNLSAKAICALGAFSKLCDLRGEKAKAAEYDRIAREFAQRWVKEADDGEKFRLAFDQPGSWSQKYNLMWDRILGLNLFPESVARKEMDFYLKNQNRYGLPLDLRKDYTKLDWITWTATLTQKRADFEALIAPIYSFLNETEDRSPMTDWYFTQTAKKRGFTARPVVGGVFAQLLYDQAVWKRWASWDKTKASGWSPIPPRPVVTEVVPAADKAPAKWRFTVLKPDGEWARPEFDDSSWSEGNSGFGTASTPGAHVGTEWKAKEIWLRREVEVPVAKLHDVQAWLHHDEDAEVYINGVLALQATGFARDYDSIPLTPPGKAALRPGKNAIAVHCRNTKSGQYIDLGLVDVEVR